MKNSLFGWIVFMMFHSFPLSAQQDYSIKLQSGTLQTPANLEQFIQLPEDVDVYNGYYYRFIQFNLLPTFSQKEELKQSGLLLLDYIPSNTFIAAIPSRYNKTLLRKFNVHSVISQQPNQKISPRISGGFSSYAINSPNTVDLIVQFYKNIPLQRALESANLQGKVLSFNEINHTITLRINDRNLKKLSAENWIFFINSISAPPLPEDTKGRSLHRSNVINSDYASGRHYDGSGVVAGLADDGEVGPHIDFQGRMTNHLTGAGGNHGDMTSGILAGAGNLDPTIRGMGTGAYLHVYDISNYTHIINAVNNFNTLGTVITSTSYSQGCNEYSTDSQFGDQLLHENPQIEFVFSAGNNGTGNCSYGAGAGWGNITGGYKSGKNVIACGNLSPLEVLDNSSSRGPASDGRIKPDICSNGLDQLSTDQDNTYQVGGGTSAASPGIAGILTQLYQAYKSLNGNQNPDAALIKASLLNSAEDIGNPGPDYTYGWGRVNTFRALRTLEESRYALDSISDLGTKNHTIIVPAGVNQMRIMVYWNDPEGSPLASKALVNNIDITITDPSTQVFNPWILNPTPNATTLNAAAVRGVDTLNNMEQVTIDNPVAGSYTLTVSGTSIPLGPQKYYIVYEFRNSDLTLTYPQGGEGFVPGEVEVIRWDAVKGIGNYTLDFSSDNGLNWNAIASVNTNTLQYAWTVPSTLSGEALIRVSRGGFSDSSDTTFTIMNLPQNIVVDWACPDSIKLSWNAVSGASGYTVYSLGTKYMDVVGSSSSNSYVIKNINPVLDHWFSVSAKAANGMDGRRALAIKKNAGVLSCPLALDVQVNAITPGSGVVQDCQNNTAIMVSMLIENKGQNSISNIPVSLQADGILITTDFIAGPLAPGVTSSFTFSVPVNISTIGNHIIKTWTSFTGDLNVYNDTVFSSIDVVSGNLSTLPFLEDFETFSLCNTGSDCGSTICGLTNGWLNEANGVIDNIDFRTAVGPTPSTGTGPDVDHTTGTAGGKYLYLEASGTCDLQEASLISPCIDLTSATGPQLSFWYHMYGADMGTLHLDVFADGVWINDVITPLSGNQGNLWMEGSKSLSAYVGKIINIRFRGITGNGFASDLALDDISVFETSAPPIPSFVVDKAVSCIGSVIKFSDQSLNSPNSWMWSFNPNTVSFVNGTSGSSQNPEVVFLQSGIYDVSLFAVNNFGNNMISNLSAVTIQTPSALPVYETFQGNTFPPENWLIKSAGGAYTWKDTIAIGSNNISNRVAFMENYNYNNPQAEDGLATLEIDLTTATLPLLTFDVSYSVYSATSYDALRIDISTDCGDSYQPSGYLKSGPTLATAPALAAYFTPTNSTDWRNDTVDLTPWIGQNVLIKFVNINGYGNNLYLDNISLSTTVGLSQTTKNETINLYPNPSSGIFTIELKDVDTRNLLLTVVDLSGRKIWEQKADPASNGKQNINLSSLQKGVYLLQLKNNIGMRQIKLNIM